MREQSDEDSPADRELMVNEDRQPLPLLPLTELEH